MEVNAANQVGLQKPFLSNRLAPFYSATLVSNSPPFTSIDIGNGSTVEASSIIADLNIAMKWLTYPSRKSGIESTAELHFGASDGNA